MGRMKILIRCWLMALLCVVVATSCSNGVPKPRGYFRIELTEKEYAVYSHDQFPCQFDYPENVSNVQLSGSNQDSAWINIVYPSYKAKIYCTYRTLNGNFQQLSEDSRNLVYKPHTVKADAITEQVYLNDEHKVYGVLYELKGNTASNIQFVMSDSTKHFLRGALYFDVNPNKDSLSPVVDYIREDIIRLVESLEWK